MDTAKQFSETCEQTLRILDWAYRGFNSSLIKAEGEKKHISSVLNSTQDLEDRDVYNEASKRVEVMKEFAQVSLTKKCAVSENCLSAGMNKHLQEALRVFNEQIQQISLPISLDDENQG